MRIDQHVIDAIEDIDEGRLDSALMNACLSVDAVARSLYPHDRVKRRYVQTLRRYYWLLEPMVGGLNFTGSRFGFMVDGKRRGGDFADLVYEVFRCAHAHGDVVPPEYSLMPHKPVGGVIEFWAMTDGSALHMPHTILPALLSVAVFSESSAGIVAGEEHFLSLGPHEFLLRESWGREDIIRPIADAAAPVRVIMDLSGP